MDLLLNLVAPIITTNLHQMASQIFSAHIDLQLKVMDFLFETIVVSILKCDNYPSDLSRREKIVTIWQFIECKWKIYDVVNAFWMDKTHEQSYLFKTDDLQTSSGLSI